MRRWSLVAGRAWRGKEGSLGDVMVAATQDVFYAEATRWGFGPTPRVTIWRNQVPELLERDLRITDPLGLISVRSEPAEELPNALVRLGWLRPPAAGAFVESTDDIAPLWFGRLIAVVFAIGLVLFPFAPIVGGTTLGVALALGLGWRFIGTKLT